LFIFVKKKSETTNTRLIIKTKPPLEASWVAALRSCAVTMDAERVWKSIIKMKEDIVIVTVIMELTSMTVW